MLHGTITMPSVLNDPDATAIATRSQRLHRLHRVVGLLDDGAPARVGDDQVRLDLGDTAQQLEEADAVDRAGGAADPHDQTLHSRNLRR
jgi:hypothetical protein